MESGSDTKNGLDWQRVFDCVAEAMIVTDARFQILHVNRAFQAMSQKDASALVGRLCHEVFAGVLCHTAHCPLVRIRSGKSHLVYQHRVHCKTRRPDDHLVTVHALDDGRGNFAGIVESIADHRQLNQARSEMVLGHERLRRNMGAIIQAMSRTIEIRDPYTAGHQRNVAKLCRAIATELGFSWARIQGLRMAAAIHDLGKIHVPSGILNKPGPMSEPEMAIIRMHPHTAYEILKDIDFPWPLAETIYQHHERLDGSGYPRGLCGDEILLEARILAVADVVESIASFRPYRLSRSLRDALSEIQRHRGVRYDETVVDACVRLIAAKGFDFKSKEWTRERGRPKYTLSGLTQK